MTITSRIALAVHNDATTTRIHRFSAGHINTTGRSTIYLRSITHGIARTRGNGSATPTHGDVTAVRGNVTVDIDRSNTNTRIIRPQSERPAI